MSAASQDETRNDLEYLVAQVAAGAQVDDNGHIGEKKALDILLLSTKCLTTVRLEDISLVSKAIYALFSKEPSKAITSDKKYQQLLDPMVTFLVEALQHTINQTTFTDSASVDHSKIQIDILRALSVLLYENGGFISTSFKGLWQLMQTIAGRSPQGRVYPAEHRRMMLNTLANLVYKTGSQFAAHFDPMYDILLKNLNMATTVAGMAGVASRKERTSERKLASSALRALHFILQEDKDISFRAITPIVDAIVKYMFFGAEAGYSSSASSASTSSSFASSSGIIKRTSYTTPSSLGPFTFSHTGSGGAMSSSTPTSTTAISSSSSSAVAFTTTSKSSYFSSGPDMADGLPRHALPSSDSEYSDAGENEYQLSQRIQSDGKVRLNALLCLQDLAKAAPKQLQPQWHKWMPDSSSTSFTFTATVQSPSLVRLIGSDPIMTVRVSACGVLVQMLEKSKQYLAMAEEKYHHFHHHHQHHHSSGGSNSISNNSSNSSSNNNNSSSNSKGVTRPSTGMLTLSERIGAMVREMHLGLARAFGKADESTETGVLVQMIKCCSAMLACCTYDRMRPDLTKILLDSIHKYLYSPEQVLQIATLGFLKELVDCKAAQEEVEQSLLTQEAAESEPAPLIQDLLILVGSKDSSPAIKVEAWGTLVALTHHHFDALRNSWSQIETCLSRLEIEEDDRVRTAGISFLEEFAKAGSGASPPLSAGWWKDTMEKLVLKIVNDNNPTIRALGCDCFSHMSSLVFDELPTRLEMVLLSLVLGATKDESALVKAASCKTLGVFILFPSLRTDHSFVMDMTSAALELCKDTNLTVRMRASWAVGNLCDAFVLLKTEGQEGILSEVLTLSTWTDVMQASLAICQDNEKLRSNGVRAIGGLLRVTVEGILERERHSLVRDAMEILVKNIEQGTLKGRWNACHAVQNVLMNDDFPIGLTTGTIYACESDLVSWTEPVYGALLNAVRQSKNFKVRINACAALTVPKRRIKYGHRTMFRELVHVLMDVTQNLDRDQADHDFSEYRYKAQLENKLLRCLDHMLQLAGGASRLDLPLDTELKQRILNSRPTAVTTNTASPITAVDRSFQDSSQAAQPPVTDPLLTEYEQKTASSNLSSLNEEEGGR
ncbi:HEAT repeat-containing protein 6 [Actinomortierella ambigua]|nr:HEAT repeat-containing protein 6 [Actinomortierella ambigua]